MRGPSPFARLGAAGAALLINAGALAGVIVATRASAPPPAARPAALVAIAIREAHRATPPPRAPERAPARSVAPSPPPQAATAAPEVAASGPPASAVSAIPVPVAAAPISVHLAAPQAPPVAQPAPDPKARADALAAYRDALWRAIAAHRPRGTAFSGTVTLHFRVNRAGALLSATVSGSSGNVLLDRQALVALRRAAPFPAPPETARDADLSFAIPLRFGAR
ncbi:TonB family protein [Novosphingobium sp. ZN18A2]|uniref:energy transducer TonB family protein n=1 Tax=Novosphingobium sp. ZN18A2 TaxID=3079861 RepID=UPI0030D09A41